jgi:hypothetical protein
VTEVIEGAYGDAKCLLDELHESVKGRFNLVMVFGQCLSKAWETCLVRSLVRPSPVELGEVSRSRAIPSRVLDTFLALQKLCYEELLAGSGVHS